MIPYIPEYFGFNIARAQHHLNEIAAGELTAKTLELIGYATREHNPFFSTFTVSDTFGTDRYVPAAQI